MSFRHWLPLALIITFFLACARERDHLLDRQDNDRIGIDFVNQLVENDSINPLTFEYLYNGGGVGVGDFDRNGLPDLFFSGNMTSSRLYLQREPWRFEEITEAAGLITTDWIAGVSIHDVDGNGYEDIYLAALSMDGTFTSPNKLYLNQGPGADGTITFIEDAAGYGIADPRYGTHAAWFDLENDGDLDLYVLNNAIEQQSRKLLRGTDTSGLARSVDVVYENTGNPTPGKRFKRLDIMKTEGWGLGVVPQDFNHDGYTDLYLANDFISEDGYLLNDGRGQLRWATQEAFAHTSKNSMGVDAADLNNDGLVDIVSVDMLPDDNLRQKTMFGDIPFRVDAGAYAKGYGRQYVRNVMQINNGDGSYSDLAPQTGTAATDWSWTPLLADFDNDGYRDLFVSNGYPKDITNRDFVDFSQANVVFGTDEEITKKVNDALNEAGGVHQPNFIYRNGPDLNFTPTDWVEGAPTYSNGAVYVDLDLDGDLDLVTNNINEPAGVYRNRSRELHPERTHYLQLAFTGPAGNPDALGAKVYLRYGEGKVSYAEQQRQRGYLGTVDATLHFGLGTASTIDSLLVVWPDGRTQLLSDVRADQRLSLAHSTSIAPANPPQLSALLELMIGKQEGPRLQPAVQKNAPVHRESPYSDFDNSALAVRDNSHAGPAMVAIDLDGDGSQELILGGAAGQAVTAYGWDGESFGERQVLGRTNDSETTVLVAFDFDGDGDDDLFIGNGSSEFTGREQLYRDQLYRNENGVLKAADELLPGMLTVTSTAVAADLEGDGDIDIFIGSRGEAGAYPRSAPSYVLVNEDGKFKVGEELPLGLVTDALWEDLDGDGSPDLLVVSEYGTPAVGWNRGGIFHFADIAGLGTGWWYSASSADLDGDGDRDVLLGNLGLNSRYRASNERPLTVRVDDYDNNGTLDPIMMMYNGNKTHPVHPRNTLGRQLPGFKRQATSYAQYGGWTDLNMPPLTEKGFELRAEEFRNFYLSNDGDGTFSAVPLPGSGQTAPIRDAIAHTDSDGRRFMLVVQNDYAVEPLGGRLDAGTGFALALGRDGKPEVLPRFWSVRGDARSVVTLAEGKYVVGLNDQEIRVYAATNQVQKR